MSRFSWLGSILAVLTTALSITISLAQPDTVRIDELFKKSKTLLRSNFDSVKWYALTARELSVKINDEPRIFESINLQGTAFFMNGIYDTAIHYFDEARMIAVILKDSSRQSKTLNNIGISYTYLGKYQESLENLMKSLAIRERTRDPLVGSTYNNLAIAYERMNQLDKALEFQFKSMEAKRHADDKSGMANTLNNIGIIYKKQGDFTSAIKYYNESLKVSEELKDDKKIANALNNLGTIYQESGQINLGNKYIEKSLQIKLRLNDNTGIARSYYNLAWGEFHLRNYPKSKKYLDEESKYVFEYGGFGMLSEYFEMRARVDSATSNFASAYNNLSKHLYYRLESLNEEKQKAISELEIQYETEKKNAQIKDMELTANIQTLNLEKANRQRIVLIIGFILVGLMAFILLRFYKLKQAANKTLSELNQTKDKLFSIVAHDLKNPLSAFRSLSQSLHDNYHLMNEESILKTLGKMNTSAANLYTMLQNLLAWSMTESGIIKANKVICDLRKLTEEVLVELHLEAELKKIFLENNIEESFKANADPKLMRIVLRNLISNAIKFTPEGGSILIQSNTNNGYAKIIVADTGIGIEQSDLPKLFQVNNDIGSHVNKGTGLGLALSKELMEKQSGAILAESIVGKGTRFTLQLSMN